MSKCLWYNLKSLDIKRPGKISPTLQRKDNQVITNPWDDPYVEIIGESFESSYNYIPWREENLLKWVKR